jgi:hypothetical protein
MFGDNLYIAYADNSRVGKVAGGVSTTLVPRRVTKQKSGDCSRLDEPRNGSARCRPL